MADDVVYVSFPHTDVPSLTINEQVVGKLAEIICSGCIVATNTNADDNTKHIFSVQNNADSAKGTYDLGVCNLFEVLGTSPASVVIEWKKGLIEGGFTCYTSTLDVQTDVCVLFVLQVTSEGAIKVLGTFDNFFINNQIDYITPQLVATTLIDDHVGALKSLLARRNNDGVVVAAETTLDNKLLDVNTNYHMWSSTVPYELNTGLEYDKYEELLKALVLLNKSPLLNQALANSARLELPGKVVVALEDERYIILGNDGKGSFVLKAPVYSLIAEMVSLWPPHPSFIKCMKPFFTDVEFAKHKYPQRFFYLHKNSPLAFYVHCVAHYATMHFGKSSLYDKYLAILKTPLALHVKKLNKQVSDFQQTVTETLARSTQASTATKGKPRSDPSYETMLVERRKHEIAVSELNIATALSDMETEISKVRPQDPRILGNNNIYVNYKKMPSSSLPVAVRYCDYNWYTQYSISE